MSYNTLTNYIDSIFDDFIPVRGLSRSLTSSPALNIVENDTSYQISILVPGIAEDKLEIEVVDNTLLVTYKHESNEEQSDPSGKLLRREYSYSSFQRSIALPNNVDPSSIDAETENGVLTITIKKNPQAQPKKITIKSKNN